MIAENETITLRVDITNKGGKLNLSISTSEEIPSYQLRGILAGGLALAIKAEDGPEKQGKAMTEVIDYLTHEFVDVNSFSDAKFMYYKS